LILTKKTHLDMETIRQLRELTTDLQALAGGKGGTLARLSQLGFPVPDGFVILPAAFEGDKLTPESWIQVREQLNRLRKEYPGASFAVRSSALAEDSVRASFAGEFETVLGVCEDGEIREAILIVRRSRMSE
jgi:pyruvate,water dikinase